MNTLIKKEMGFAHLICFVLPFAIASCRMAVSLSPLQNTNASEWQCLKQFGTKAVYPIWFAEDGVEADTAQNYHDARAAGFDTIDLYAAICPLCPKNDNITQVIDQISDYTNANNMSYGVLYLMIIYDDTWWTLNKTQNLAYLVNGVKYALSLNVTVGIFSDQGDWFKVIDGWDDTLATTALWYSHENDKADFEDWDLFKFGEWTTPMMKDFGSDAVCSGTVVEYNWFP